MKLNEIIKRVSLDQKEIQRPSPGVLQSKVRRMRPQKRMRKSSSHSTSLSLGFLSCVTGIQIAPTHRVTKLSNGFLST